MLKIGDFSKICQTSIKALRHWDAIGLLKPALIDPETNYRYYSIEQIDVVNRVMAFRVLGLALGDIVRLLHDVHLGRWIDAPQDDPTNPIRLTLAQDAILFL
jgi:DNA-binding transcriptional MerR regulator